MLSPSKLSTRLPAAMIGLALLSATAMGGFSWYSAKAGLFDAARERLQLAASLRKDSVPISRSRRPTRRSHRIFRI